MRSNNMKTFRYYKTKGVWFYGYLKRNKEELCTLQETLTA